MVWKKTNKGAQGIGTLIIFIALILVAAVAAGVLIQTASSLQSKALDVGRQSQQKITTDIEVIQIFVKDTRNGMINAGSDNITILVRLGSGSGSVKLQDLLIKYDTAQGSQTVVAANATSTGNYSVNFVIEGTNHNPNYLVEGDLAELTFTSLTNVTEAESTTLRLIAKNGAVKPVDITTPDAMVEATTYLYP